METERATEPSVAPLASLAAPFNGHGGQSVAFSPDGRLLAAVMSDRDKPFECWALVWDLSRPDRPRLVARHQTERVGSNAVLFGEGGALFIGGYGKVIRVDPLEPQVRAELDLKVYVSVEDLAWVPGERALGVCVGTSVLFLDPAQGQLSPGLTEGFKVEPSRVAFSADGRWAATPSRSSRQRHLHLWDVPQRKWVRALSPGRGGWACAAFAPDGSALVAGNGGSAAFEVRAVGGTWKRRQVLAGRHTPRAAVFSPDGKLLATSAWSTNTWSGDGVHLWRAGTFEPLGHATWSPGDLQAVRFSPDGRLLAGIEFGRAVVHLWSTRALLGEPA